MTSAESHQLTSKLFRSDQTRLGGTAESERGKSCPRALHPTETNKIFHSGAPVRRKAVGQGGEERITLRYSPAERPPAAI